MNFEMGFIEEWSKAIASDPNWQFEELYEEIEEEDPKLAEAFAEAVWWKSTVEILAINKLAMQGIYVLPEELWQARFQP